MTSGTVALQCVAAVAGTLLGEALGPTLPAKLVAGVLGALIGAFLTAPGRHRRRRIVAVALLLALLDALRRAAGALASERRQPPGAWVPASWTAVGLTAVAGFAGGSAVTTVRDGWAQEPARIVSVPEVRGEPRAAALAILADAGLRATATAEASESVPEGSATRTDPPAGASVEEDAQVALFLSSGPPGAVVRIPAVTGRERGDARALLVDAGLRPRVREEPSRAIEAGHATRTDPPAGTRVDRGARVALLVSSGPAADPVAVPDVRGRPRADALAVLRDAGLSVRTSTEESAEVDEGAATRTDPAAGTEVERGSTVTLFLSSGTTAGQVEVPDVAGSTREEAFATLEDAGLSPQGAAEASDAVAAGTVIRTDPVAGTLVDEGSPVTVVVSSGPPPLTVPDVVGLASDAAVARLRQDGLGAATTFVDSTAPSETVVRSDPAPGTVVEEGDTVRLFLSCGGPCVD